MSAPPLPEVLHYVGYDEDRGGILAVVRALSASPLFSSRLGVNPGFTQRGTPGIATVEFPAVRGERIGGCDVFRARSVARQVQAWLSADGRRVFHGHSRAGLVVALWLWKWGDQRVVVSVHCYGRHRWFYRWAARRLGGSLFWLSPEMKRYYGLSPVSWERCIPGCIPPRSAPVARRVAGDPIRLGGVGSLVRWKNWGLVLEALAQLPADVRERFRFSQIGGTDGSSDSEKYAQELVDLTRQLALGTVVEWRGVQGSADGLLAEIDCLLIVSTNEPFSIAMIEAWQMGVPVLAADSGGARDAVSPGKTGWLFRTGAAACLARALARLAATDCLAQVRIEPGDLQPFTSPMVAAQWAKVYASVLSPQRPQR